MERGEFPTLRQAVNPPPSDPQRLLRTKERGLFAPQYSVTVQHTDDGNRYGDHDDAECTTEGNRYGDHENAECTTEMAKHESTKTRKHSGQP
jgi:hypothetical protein